MKIQKKIFFLAVGDGDWGGEVWSGVSGQWGWGGVRVDWNGELKLL